MSFAMQLSHPDDYEGGHLVQLMDEQEKVILSQEDVVQLFYLIQELNIEFIKLSPIRKSIVGWCGWR